MNKPQGISRFSRYKLAGYDFYFLLDASRVMNSESSRFPGKSLWQEALAFASSFSSFVDDVSHGEGAYAITFSTQMNEFGRMTLDDIGDIFSMINPNGGTLLAGPVECAIEYARQSTGPAIIVTILASKASDQDRVLDQIRMAKDSLKDQFPTFLFIQMGNNAAVAEFFDLLDTIDEDRVKTIRSDLSDPFTFREILERALAD